MYMYVFQLRLRLDVYVHASMLSCSKTYQYAFHNWSNNIAIPTYFLLTIFIPPVTVTRILDVGCVIDGLSRFPLSICVWKLGMLACPEIAIVPRTLWLIIHQIFGCLLESTSLIPNWYPTWPLELGRKPDSNWFYWFVKNYSSMDCMPFECSL